jgi:RNA methyltransferase, TrmH family
MQRALTITSTHNEKLKLVRKLHQRKHREREDLFVSEGEDLLQAGLAAGEEPVELLTAAGAGLGGTEVEAEVLASVSAMGSGTRAIGVWRRRADRITGPVCVYLHGVGDPGNVGAVIRTAHALVAGTVVLGPDCADPHSPKAVRASMGAIFEQAVARGGLGETLEPRMAMVARGGRPLGDGAADDGLRLAPPVTVCLGAEREGLPSEVVAACEDEVSIPLRERGVESLNVAAAAAIVLHRISSAAMEARDA